MTGADHDDNQLTGQDIEDWLKEFDSAVKASKDLKPLDSSSGTPKNGQGVPAGQTFEDRKQDTLSHANLNLNDHKNQVSMRTAFGYVIIIALVLQLASVNVLFWRYGEVRNWAVPDRVMLGWFTSTIVQVVGVAYVVAEHLFKGQPTSWTDR